MRSFSRSACFILDFPVGLIRSPTMMGSSPISTAWDQEEITVLCFSSMGFGTMARQRSTVFRMCSGVVPQQPPIIHTPMEAISSISRAKASASMS